MIWVLIIAALVAAGLVARYGKRRTPYEPGVTSFQRHIDALSPERRRESFDRVRPQPRPPHDGSGH